MNQALEDARKVWTMANQAAMVETLAEELKQSDPENAVFTYRAASILYLRAGNIIEAGDTRATYHMAAARCSVAGHMPDLALDLVINCLSMDISNKVRGQLVEYEHSIRQVVNRVVTESSNDPEDIEDADINRLYYIVSDLSDEVELAGTDSSAAYRIRCLNSLINVTGSEHDRMILVNIRNEWERSF